ncbi:MAG TPA: hypothetical protein VKT32_00625 [Chthonomonadaceae bacterium]|nr:hypothetical protein [Chthonomonadaceae bacterium]
MGNLESALHIALAVTLVVTVGLFGVGYWVGARSRNRITAGSVLALIALCLQFGLLVATWHNRIGPVVTWEALLFAGALDIALLGGFFIGGARAGGALTRANATGLLVALLLAADLATAFARAEKVRQAAHEIGMDTPTARYEPPKDQGCAQNLQKLYFAFSQYAQDWGALPPADNWDDNQELIGKVQRNEWLHCPAVSNGTDDKYGYAYNPEVAGRSLNGKPLKALPDAAKTPLLYDSTDLAKNAHDTLTSLPKPGRHGGKDYILYCDGHVEAVAPK